MSYGFLITDTIHLEIVGFLTGSSDISWVKREGDIISLLQLEFHRSGDCAEVTEGA